MHMRRGWRQGGAARRGATMRGDARHGGEARRGAEGRLEARRGGEARRAQRRSAAVVRARGAVWRGIGRAIKARRKEHEH